MSEENHISKSERCAKSSLKIRIDFREENIEIKILRRECEVDIETGISSDDSEWKTGKKAIVNENLKPRRG